MRLKWSARARRDILELADYYSKIDPGLAERMERAVEASPLTLLDYPHSGPATIRPGVRKWRVRGTPYMLYYRTPPEYVIILRVLHASRDVRL